MLNYVLLLNHVKNRRYLAVFLCSFIYDDTNLVIFYLHIYFDIDFISGKYCQNRLGICWRCNLGLIRSFIVNALQ